MRPKFCLRDPFYENVLKEVVLGHILEDVETEEPNSGYNRLVTTLYTDEPTLVIATRRNGIELEGELTGSKIVDVECQRDKTGASAIDLTIHTETGSIKLCGRPLSDVVCFTGKPFEQIIGGNFEDLMVESTYQIPIPVLRLVDAVPAA